MTFKHKTTKKVGTTSSGRSVYLSRRGNYYYIGHYGEPIYLEPSEVKFDD